MHPMRSRAKLNRAAFGCGKAIEKSRPRLRSLNVGDCMVTVPLKSWIQNPLWTTPQTNTAATPPFGRAMFPATAGSSFPSTVAKLMSPHYSRVAVVVAAWQGKQGRRNIAISGGNDEVLQLPSITATPTVHARSFFSRVSSLLTD